MRAALYFPVTLMLIVALAALSVWAVWAINGMRVYVADVGNINTDVIVNDAGRLTHLMKDHVHITAWLVVKIALRLGANYNTYFCPPGNGYQPRVVVVVSDETDTYCALAIIRAIPNADGTNSLITSFCRPCAKVASMLKRDSCVPITRIKFIFP